MKARVDSKEFSTAMAQAMKWTVTTGIDASSLVILRAIDGYVLIRTTVMDGDSVLAVNAFDVEHGDVITRASLLSNFAWATDGFLNISVEEKKLKLDYEGFPGSEINTMKRANFPALMDIPHSATITKDILLAAAAHTAPFAKTGLPMKSSVHIIPAEDGAFVVGSDAVIGYRRMVSAEIGKSISIEALTLTKALGGISGAVQIGVNDAGRVEVASRDSPSRIQFSSMSCPDPKDMVGFFDPEIAGTEIDGEPLVISKERMKMLHFLAGKAAAVDVASATSEIQIGGDDGTVTGKILGAEHKIPEFDIADGCASPIVFLCSSLYRALGVLSDADEYEVSIGLYNGEPRMWYIDAEAKHFIVSSVSGRFK